MTESTSISESGASMLEQAAAGNPPPAPPPPQRRPRVREVSSRFMSPVASSSSSYSPLPNNKQRSTSAQRQRRHLDMDPFSSVDENRPSRSPPRKHHLPQQPRSVVKLFKENETNQHQHQHPRSLRPDTPVVSSAARLRLMQPRSTLNNVSAASRLLQSTTNLSNSDSILSSNESSDDRSCSTQSLRSSMPEADMLPTVSSRILAEKNTRGRPHGTPLSDSSKLLSASPCSRSLDLARSMSEHPLKDGNKPAKKMGGLPPRSIEVSSKLAIDFSRKAARKASGHQEDVHFLRLLHNHYLQWRYANAKSEASAQALRRETEISLYSLGMKIDEMCDSVRRKRIELGVLRRAKILSTILESQMPYLEQWSSFEEDYLTSLSEAIQALLNSSVQLPISSNIRLDVKEVGEALNSAVKLMELVAYHVQRLMPKAEEIDILISELARVTGHERALIEECGDWLFMTHNSQVEECSLRGQLIQLHRSGHGHDQLQEHELLTC